ncbi:hypothetical protein H6G00_33145 [Leptolyngbya sp. FACHB-541]|uniref:hypothetical protein n=1 Tax=Leptolyngbya sp. FACHB-541 TaxID=2692810 RepID=UPI00168802C2|nr:hypothetical protein [Leptolyngbya sp. FACHB-541]MBD2001388.1 hypothetical protein [Leptolyngbya sp. FACHB-541]
MNQYLQAFEKVAQSTEQLLDAQYNSLESVEIKQTASVLQESTASCIAELRLSTTKLNETLKLCFDNLALGEEVWQSKQRIREASSLEIWQQLGEISGCKVRIQTMTTAYKITAIGKLTKSWNERAEELRKKYFVDSKGRMKDGIGWDDKKGFLLDVRPILLAQSNEMSQVIREGLVLIFQDLAIINFNALDSSLKLLDTETAKKSEFKIKDIFQAENLKFKDPKSLFGGIPLLGLHDLFSQAIKDLQNRWGDIEWKHVAQNKDEISRKIQKQVTTIFDDRVRLVEECLEQLLCFYNNFLELQSRYQQETPEQRLAEKSWIEQQQREFEKVQIDINAVLGQTQEKLAS